jgi:hypothetical protein
MTMELVREGEQGIERELSSAPDPVVLYDCGAMEPPDMALAMEMKAFDGRIRNRIGRAATVVRDPMTAFMSKVAFALTREHRVFYQDLDAALRWLTEADSRPQAAVGG